MSRTLQVISEPLYSDEFVGRRDELEFLEEEFRAVCAGGARCITIEGEAGIGKSRLLAEFCNGIQREASVLRGACSQDVRSPYLPFVEILDAAGHAAAALRPHSPRPRSEEKSAFFNAVADVVRRESARSPAVIVLEDIQWADNASMELLRYLLQRAVSWRCFFLVSVRSQGTAGQPAVAALRSAASRGRGATVRLRALRRHEIKHLVQSALAKRSASLQPAMLAQIEVLAEGNPLFAEELAQTALENGELSFDTAMPISLEAILSERLMPFSNVQRETLYRAAVIGQSVDSEFLAAVEAANAADILELMQRAVESGLMRQSPDSPGTFVFRHELIRQALADQLVLALAAPLHVRIAEAIEARPGAGERAAELAYHWSAARKAEKARYWNEAAAKNAWRLFAYRDAIRFYSDALRWNYPPGTQRALLYEYIGTLLYIEGVGDEPAVWFRRAKEEYRACGNAIGAAEALFKESDQHWVDARTEESVSGVLEAAHELRRLGHSPMYASAMLGVARYHVTLGNVEAARGSLAEIEPLRDAFDAGTKAAWHEVRGETFSACGDVQSAFAEFRASARLCAQMGVSELIAQIENNFALAAFDLGELDLAVARHQIAVDEAERTAMPWRIAYCYLNYARTLMYKGQYERARRCLRESLEAAVTTATYKTKVASVGIPLALKLDDRALLSACAGEQALQLAERSGEAQRIASTAAAFAELRAAQGSVTEAQVLLSRALHDIRRPHRSWDLLVAVFRWGSADDKRFARELLRSAPGRPLVVRAYRLLCEAIDTRDRDAARAARIARIALVAFDRMRNEFHASLARAIAEPQIVPPTSGGSASPRALSKILTPRQLQIAKLVATGETNRSIGAVLKISEHTVEHHLSDIFARLSLHSRAQLAHLMAREEAPI